MNNTNNSPFQPLHPTLKKCKCGFVGIRSSLYKHLAFSQAAFGLNNVAFFINHGEVPLRPDDPTLQSNLLKSI